MTKVDRAFGNATACLATVEDWRGAGVALHPIGMGGQAVDTSTAMGGFFLLMPAGTAEWELATVRERTRAALQHHRAQGEHLGADPLGLSAPPPSSAWEPLGDDVATVRFILSRRARRRGRPPAAFREIAAALTAADCRTERGGRRHASTVRAISERRSLHARLLAPDAPSAP